MDDPTLKLKVKNQIEFYFSDSNFRKDTYLRAASETDPDGFVPISTLLTFNKLKSLTTDISVVAESVNDSTIVCLSEDKLKLKRASDLPTTDSSTIRTLYVKGFPTDDETITIESVREKFSEFGKVLLVRLRKYHDSKLFKGSCFIEFENPEQVESVIKAAHVDGEVVMRYKDTPFIRVCSLSDWLQEKKSHRSNGSSNTKPSTSSDNKNDANEVGDKRKRNNDNEDEEKTKPEEAAKPKYTEGLIIKLTNIPPTSNRFQIKDTIKAIGDLKYVEYDDGQSTAFLRMADTSSTEVVMKALSDGLVLDGGVGVDGDGDAQKDKESTSSEEKSKLQGEIISGEEELNYYIKMVAQSSSHSSRGGGRGGGRGGRGGGGRGRGGRFRGGGGGGRKRSRN